MTTVPTAAPRFLTDPHTVVVRAVAAAEPALDPATVAKIVAKVASTRPALRRLARALHDDPALLTSGRPEGPRLVGSLIAALQRAGAQQVTRPRCALCDRVADLRALHEGRRVCAVCARRVRAIRAVCAGCQQERRVAGKDRQRRLLCSTCARRSSASDYLCHVVDQLTALDMGLDAAVLREIVTQALPRSSQQRDILGELDAQPRLLRDNPASGSHRLVLLAEALLAAGAVNVAPPTCPFCHRSAPLRFRRGDWRCCKTCYETGRAERCIRCGHARPVASRSPAGDAVCKPCTDRDPVNHDRCAGCGRHAALVRADDGQLRCRACWRAPLAVCSICRRRKPCHRAGTERARCEACSKRLNCHACVRCGTVRVVFARDAAGQPLCQPCAARRERCTGCHRTLRVVARPPDGPQCATCWKREPAAARTCAQCGRLARLHHFGLCARCACPQVLRSLLSHPDGTMSLTGQAVLDALTADDPTAVLKWLESRTPRAMLTDLAGAAGPVSHDIIDQLRPVKAAARLRDILVARGALPARDEYLAALERWLDSSIVSVADAGERQLLRRFATWHYLRRLRQRSSSQPMTYGQATAVRGDFQAVLRLLAWLHSQGRTLATARQSDLDAWLASGPSSYRNAHSFVAWAVRHGHARQLDIPVRTNPTRRQVFPETDRRWTIIRRLLHDDSLDIVDRVAGLLILLYGQPASRIVALTVDQIGIGPEGTQLSLGRTPLHLPSPLDDLVGRLLARRHGFTSVGRTTDHPWLFAGGSPGRPLSAARLVERLLALGLPARVGRNTALMDLARQLPAAVLSQLLGLHIAAATAWTVEAGNTRPAYAASLARNRR